ncbi:DUF3018 family protein [Fulvimarina endophytica]|uniref:DUF3018 family protein n=1 Tax=Fulvimarina endophytica TaxID=2293836 RepID=A0A371X5E6_9HYPH|nr:antitoxin MazE-like protein [Fulvimarina endophytica]RFC64445.1 DUF3018 family protein [Fulvimarina endophytica]
MGRPQELTSEERESLQSRGWRPIEVWVIDRDSETYRTEAARQARNAADADLQDGEIDRWLEHMQSGLPDGDTA